MGLGNESMLVSREIGMEKIERKEKEGVKKRVGLWNLMKSFPRKNSYYFGEGSSKRYDSSVCSLVSCIHVWETKKIAFLQYPQNKKQNRFFGVCILRIVFQLSSPIET